MTDRIIGIDPSLSATGIATPSEAYTVATEASDPQRLVKIHTAARIALIEGGRAHLAVIEDLPTHAHGAGLTGMAQGVIRLALVQFGVPYVAVTAATLKKFATGSGNANKSDMRMALYKRAGLDIRDDNQVDAIWLRQIGLHLTDHRDAIALPKAHTDALLKVKRP